MKKLSALVGAVAVLALAGCSTSKAPTSDTTTYPLTLTLQQVEHQAGCVSTTPETVQVYANAAVSCVVGAHTLYIYTFDSDALRDQWLKVAKSFGGSYQQGTSWVIQTE